MTIADLGAAPIPLTKLDHHDPALLEELLAVVARVASTSAFTGGPEVALFEEEFASYTGTRCAVGVGSGTDALALGLQALGIGKGDQVVVPANSFIATAEAVTLAGAEPRFADVDPVTHVVTAQTIEAALTPRVKAIIPVHLYGRTVDLAPLARLASERGLHLIEDACQAHGAWYRGRRAGAWGVFGAFSFYPAKNLGAWGDGGALTTDDPRLAARVRLLRSHGEKPRYHHRIPGTTSRLDALQAAILRVKLRRLDSVNAGRRRAAALLSRALVGTGVAAPMRPALDGDHVYHQFVITTDERDRLREHLDACGIATGVHYPVPIHRSHAYARPEHMNGSDPAPACSVLAERVCSLPIHPGMDLATAERIASAVRGFAT